MVSNIFNVDNNNNKCLLSSESAYDFWRIMKSYAVYWRDMLSSLDIVPVVVNKYSI